ncbi:MAG: hypothetical protein HOD92_05250 [Deltaproteobacteria bacterium]|jgi:hypothetical protein|nr:hypothetical protein [Deltaproteobacteria bacterium]MBT4527004.1 hypothetical protein [Deltaproteobacteria bacterium]
MSLFNKSKRPDDYDPVEEAWKSQDLKKMLKALKWKAKKPLSRHFLLLYIVQHTFTKRKESKKMAQLCDEMAQIHLSELNQYTPLLQELFGQLPNIQTHHYLATILSESHHYDDAIQVCLQALAIGIPPGKGGSYKDRIKIFETTKQKLIHQP